MNIAHTFNEKNLIEHLREYLPAQAPLKDFVHHNTLHEFQHLPFHQGIANASKIFGYRTYLSFPEYQELYAKGKIKTYALKKAIQHHLKDVPIDAYLAELNSSFHNCIPDSRIGQLRKFWKSNYHFDLNARVHVNLFRLLNSYLDQGVAVKKFPTIRDGFLNSVKELDKQSFKSLFRTKEARALLHDHSTTITSLLKKLVDDESLFEQYVFDQQFEHPGWSGLVAVIEVQPNTLLDKRIISLHDLVLLELLFEIDTLTHQFKQNWKPISQLCHEKPKPIFENFKLNQLDIKLAIWQDAFEWSYYDEVLKGVSLNYHLKNDIKPKSFQAIFCIDDREISLREYIENIDQHAETFGTAGHFGIDTYFKPKEGKFITKICPVPLAPKHLIKEESKEKNQKKEVLLNKGSHNLFSGWIIAQTLGFWSAMKLFLNVFKPTISPASASSFRHMDHSSDLTVENKSIHNFEDNLQVGFTIPEMANRVETVLKSIGLVDNFSSLVYVIGHGASSTNNTHFSAYDCGACSGRPGSVNARVFSYMANHKAVRLILEELGISIPDSTEFMGALHDTTTDDILFFDKDKLSPNNKIAFENHQKTFTHALDLNAKERSRRFDLVRTDNDAKSIHQQVRLRSVSLFEPRPEYNHATNTLCIVGRRNITKNLCLDRRAFLNSYDYRCDENLNYLAGILNAVTPVCGGINLEYYFSRVDNQKLGAGSKLPHNVMGLIGVANGVEGDLRPGLPAQMVEIHDPMRLMIIVEQVPENVLVTIKKFPSTYEWYINNWVHLVVISPQDEQLYYFRNGQFSIYLPVIQNLPNVNSFNKIIENHSDNLPVFKIQNQLV